MTLLRRFWHSSPIVTVEHAWDGWRIVILFEDQREFLDSFDEIGDAIRYARETSRLNEIRFVPGRAHLAAVKEEVPHG